MFGAFFSSLFDFLYPKQIEVLTLEALTPHELLTKLTPAMDTKNGTISLFNYADPNVRKLIWEIKYRRNTKIIDNVSSALYDVLTAELEDKMFFENFVHPLLLPIPISKKRRLERDFNQTELICEALKKLDTQDELEYSSNVLKKVVHTESQTLTKNKKERIKNMENTMRADSTVLGRNIILIDDVTTTGATMSDARRALRECGAKKIICFTLAH